MEDSLETLIEKFNTREKSAVALFGGDGTLVGEWRKHHVRKGGKALLPVRNYGLCPKHLEFYIKFFSCKESAEGEEASDLSVKQFLFPVLRGEFKNQGLDNYLDALSELTVTSADPTQAVRFTVRINGKPVVENSIANGVIFATRLGSTGYFKSVARTIFIEGVGIGFICPTYSLPNIVARPQDRIEFELLRKAPLVLTADKLKQEIPDAVAGFKLIASSACDNVSVLGYDHFMCPECRKNRNSTLVNDSYCIV